MRFVSFREGSDERLGIVRGGQVAVATSSDGSPLTMLDVINGGPDLIASLCDRSFQMVPLDRVQLLPPITAPSGIFCVGINYAEHEREAPIAGTDFPTMFLRLARNQIADGAPMISPTASQTLDWEGELVAVIGKGGRHIQPENAFDHIFGYSIYNEASVREFQHHSSQFGMGKNFEGTGAFGPCIVTADEFGDPYAKTIKTWLNEDLMQSAPVSSMIHRIEDVIAYVSSATSLKPGDVICTGTPSGVGAARTPPTFMRDGDIVRVEVTGIGALTNPVQGESALAVE